MYISLYIYFANWSNLTRIYMYIQSNDHDETSGPTNDMNIYIYIYIIVQNTSKTYHYSLFHPEGIFRW